MGARPPQLEINKRASVLKKGLETIQVVSLIAKKQKYTVSGSSALAALCGPHIVIYDRKVMNGCIRRKVKYIGHEESVQIHRVDLR